MEFEKQTIIRNKSWKTTFLQRKQTQKWENNPKTGESWHWFLLLSTKSSEVISFIQNVSSKFIQFSLSPELDCYNYDANNVNEVDKVKADGSIIALNFEGAIEVIEIDNDPKTKLLRLKEKQFRINKQMKK